MKRKTLFILLVVTMFVMLTAIPGVSLADAGGFAGDSDWGGSDWGGSDWGGSDWGDSDWGDSDSSFGGLTILPFLTGGGGSFVWVLIAIVVAYFILRAIKSKKKGASAPLSTAPPVPADLSALRASDCNFSEQIFIENAKNLYVRLQNAWQAKELSPIRPQLSAAMFAQLSRQLEPFIANKQTNHVDRITVFSAVITKLAYDEANEMLTVRLNTRIVDYVTDDATQTIIRGSNTKELFMTYDWTFTRTKGTVTPLEEGETRSTCPSCGAPVDLNQSAVCEYCGAVISSASYNWVLSEIKGVSQRSSM